MGVSSADYTEHQSLNGTCVDSCSSLSSCVGLFRAPALTRQSGCATSPSLSTSSPSASDIMLSLSLFHSVQFCCFFFITSTDFCFFSPLHNAAGLKACRKRFEHLLSLPAEIWTCVIVNNPLVRCAHSVVHVQLDHRSISNSSNVRILFIRCFQLEQQTFCIEMKGVDNTRTSECYAPSTSLVCLEWNRIFNQRPDHSLAQIS